MKKTAKGGVMVKLNGNQPVQKTPGAPQGVGPTKSQKASKQTKTKPYSGGGNKSVPKPKKG
jgi:hypothetical protein